MNDRTDDLKTFLEQRRHEEALPLAVKQAAGLSGAALGRAMAPMEAMRVSYANPLVRLPMTFMEIAPVGLVVSLVSAALLRNPRILPAR